VTGFNAKTLHFCTFPVFQRKHTSPSHHVRFSSDFTSSSNFHWLELTAVVTFLAFSWHCFIYCTVGKIVSLLYVLNKTTIFIFSNRIDFIAAYPIFNTLRYLGICSTQQTLAIFTNSCDTWTLLIYTFCYLSGMHGCCSTNCTFGYFSHYKVGLVNEKCAWKWEGFFRSKHILS